MQLVPRVVILETFGAAHSHVVRRIHYDIQIAELGPGLCRGEQIGVLKNRRLVAAVDIRIDWGHHRVHDAFPRPNADLILIPAH